MLLPAWFGTVCIPVLDGLSFCQQASLPGFQLLPGSRSAPSLVSSVLEMVVIRLPATASISSVGSLPSAISQSYIKPFSVLPSPL